MRGYAEAARQPALLFSTEPAVQVTARAGRRHHAACLEKRSAITGALEHSCKRALHGLALASFEAIVVVSRSILPHWPRTACAHVTKGCVLRS